MNSIHNSLVRDTMLHAVVTPTHTEHSFSGRKETWIRIRELGRGGCGTVWLEKCDKVREDIPSLRAVKQIRVDARQPVDPSKELEAFAKFSQPRFEPFFVKSFGWFATSDSIFITSMYHELGDLDGFLQQPLPEVEARLIAEQLLEGLSHMHDNGFVHRDLKPKWVVRITDFGITKKFVDNATVNHTVTGTPGYMAPEIFNSSLKGPPPLIDMFALGSMIYFMLTNELPIRNWPELQQYGTQPHRRIATNYHGAEVTKEARDLVTALLARSPMDRPTAAAAMINPWFEQNHGDEADWSDYESSEEDVAELGVHLNSMNPWRKPGGSQVVPLATNAWSTEPPSSSGAMQATNTWSTEPSFRPDPARTQPVRQSRTSNALRNPSGSVPASNLFQTQVASTPSSHTSPHLASSQQSPPLVSPPSTHPSQNPPVRSPQSTVGQAQLVNPVPMPTQEIFSL
ncbi:unnamed protein product [Periconia digitata]|uniref:mitogen-activated protein kinase kinase n=1 Tax=Periconia digitata TaxID=1303443 RepID=A0A9W4XRA6_9PLEO|nr:unnamed protein product [Periconia digitata]